MSALQRIRKETGMSVSEAIKVHAEQGCSRTLTASTLGITRQTLQRICERFDLDKYFKPQKDMTDGCRPGNNTGKGWPKGAGKLWLRKPIECAGVVYYPGEPMHHYLFSKKHR